MVTLNDNPVLAALAGKFEKKAARSAAARKGAETKRENKRLAALAPKVKTLFSPAPVFRSPHVGTRS
jgi:hypothetical protein